MGSGPAGGRNRRVSRSRALLRCLALTALFPAFAVAQTLTPDMLRPVRGGFVSLEDSPLRKIGPERAGVLPDPSGAPRSTSDKPAASRVGQVPTYGPPAATGAAVESTR